MKICFTLLAVVMLAVVGLTPIAPSHAVAVSDAEAATLYGGGCVDGDPDHDETCGGASPCHLTRGYSEFVDGSGNQVNVNCGVYSCGTVDLTTCVCE